ncbi:fused MFS/spermidine synthase [Candidatus Vampirococcus lugosii]|uniref:Polyamine aminopropyltransferase n=1 Tax=Candidatus Vampirococcus lugosii TaxID=2789015 RepID=A0ABS5QJS7_9BACT|nr:spermidine synthase [Candidatus Vampirococcus lugosii]
MLYFLIFLSSISGLVYQLLLGTISSYLIGNSVLQFSMAIGLFLTGLGIGSYIVRLFKNNIKTFFIAELLLGVIGGFSVFLIKFLYIYFFTNPEIFQLFYIIIVLTIGTITGLEIPLIASIIDEEKKKNKTNSKIKDIVSDVFTYDYAGALIATFLFPFILLPWIGVENSAILMGLLNIIIAIWFIYLKQIKKYVKVSNYILSFLIVLLFYLILAIGLNSKIENIWNNFFYKDTIIHSEKSAYQNIIITKGGDDIRLYIDNNLQFMSLDEHRYHSGLWQHGKEYVKNTDKKNWNILVLGGGDGLLTRDIIETMQNRKYKIKIIDLDPAVTKIARENKVLKSLNKNSLNNKNVEVINKDAFNYIIKEKEIYDIIIADFPDPRNTALSKLYSKEFYNGIHKILDQNGLFTTQASNAFFANESFWCIYKTLQESFNNTIAYNVYIPSFGSWGFISASKSNILTGDNDMINYKFDKDYQVNIDDIKINTLDNPNIIQYYLNGWKKFNL